MEKGWYRCGNDFWLHYYMNASLKILVLEKSFCLALNNFKPKIHFQVMNFTKDIDPHFLKFLYWSGLVSHRKKPLSFSKVLYSFLAVDDKQIWLVRKSVCLFLMLDVIWNKNQCCHTGSKNNKSNNIYNIT